MVNKIRGLTQAEVHQRKKEGLSNKPVEVPSKTVKDIIVGNVFTYFNFVFVVITALLLWVKSFRDLTFLPIILANTAIGILQEMRAKVELDKIMLISTPKAKVMREGQELEVKVHQLVKDDIVVFGAGDQIPADAVVVEGEIAVNEALLTGEADEVAKPAGEKLLSGSFVVSGQCFARLTKVGAESYISKLTLEAKKVKNKEQSEIIRSLTLIVKVVGILIIPIGLLLFWGQFFVEAMPLKDSIQSMVAAVIGMIPEGLFLLSSIALALSAMRLAQNKVLLHDMKSIETLARVDILCVDKTGTITEDKMSVQSFWALGQTEQIELEELLGDFVRAQAPDTTTMGALKEHFVKTRRRQVVKVVGFSSQYKYSGVEFKEGIYVLGAPELVLGKKYQEYKSEIEGYSRRGYRVLILVQYSQALTGGELTGEVIPCGFVVLANPVRQTAPQTFKYFVEQGVKIKVISGDNPLTVAEVAKRAGIEGADKYIDASTLKTKRLVEEAVLKYTVFGRVSPKQKRLMVKALQKAGHTVAMTGDGVNDVLALKDADCSVAMASGSEAAAQAAQMVLMDSDFAKMPEVVREGRRVVNNLERSGSLFLVKNIFSLITALLVIILRVSYPLIPAQISLISAFTIGIPAFLLSQIPNEDLIRGKFIKNVLMRAAPGGLTNIIFVLLIVFVGESLAIPREQMATSCTIALCIIGLMMVYRVSRPMNRYKWLIWGVCAVGLLVSLIFVKPLFGIAEQMFLESHVLWLMAAMFGWPLLNIMAKFVEWLSVRLAEVWLKTRSLMRLLEGSK